MGGATSAKKIMLFYILVLVSGIVAISFCLGSDYDKIANTCGSFFMCCIFSAFVLFMCCMSSKWTEINRENFSVPIFSLKTEKDISGSFFLGSGGFGSDEKYYYFCQDKRGGYYRGVQYAHNCFIFEKDSVPPQITWQKITYKCPSWIVPWTVTRRENTPLDLIVPIGTVIQKFEVK